MEDNKSIGVEVPPVDKLVPHDQEPEGPPVKADNTPTLILPLALRDTEITESDVAVLLRVAQDKNATSGRYNRIPKQVQVSETTSDVES